MSDPPLKYLIQCLAVLTPFLVAGYWIAKLLSVQPNPLMVMIIAWGLGWYYIKRKENHA